jgi:DNA-binding GntR family transcriptional regulator
VEFADAKGPRVAIITLADAVDIYELRCVLEGLIVQLFTLRAKAKDIKALEKALEENRQALKEGELQQVIDSARLLRRVARRLWQPRRGHPVAPVAGAHQLLARDLGVSGKPSWRQ